MKITATFCASVVTIVAFLGLNAASAAAAPEWSIVAKAPDRVVPGSTFHYRIIPSNVGDEPTDVSDPLDMGALDIALPAGIEGVSFDTLNFPLFEFFWSCGDPAGAMAIHCDYKPPFPLPVAPGQEAFGSPIMLEVEAAPGLSGLQTAELQISGGGASNTAGDSSVVNASATPDFGLSRWEAHIPPDEDGALQAGGHPDDIVTDFDLNTFEGEGGGIQDVGPLGGYGLFPEAGPRSLVADLPPGFVGAPSSTGTCELGDLVPNETGPIPACPIDSIVGTVSVRIAQSDLPPSFVEDGVYNAPIFNMRPPRGEAPRFGFNVYGFAQQLEAVARTDGDLGIQVRSLNTSQGLTVLGAKVTFWGVPADPSHDFQRCQLIGGIGAGEPSECRGEVGDPETGPNPAEGSPQPFLTLPTSCSKGGEGLRFDLFAESWPKPSIPTQTDSVSFATTKNPPIDNTPLGTTGCDRVPFDPKITVQPTTDEAETPTGLEVALSIPPDGIENPTGISQSNLKDATVTLPEGMTANPSQANGLAVCSAAQIGLTSGDSETIRFNKAKPNCPDASQLGEVRVDTPLLEEPLNGAAYLASQDDPSRTGAENPFNSTLALYVAVQGAGQLAKLAGEVAPDPKTGQLVVTFLNNPQVPFSRFFFKFKGGQRAPLTMPPTCGTHTVKAELTPWARPNDPLTITDSFQVSKGPNGGPCPSGGALPFKPAFTAGSINNNAGSYSPFVMRLLRGDGEQDMTKFSAVLPPGELGKLAGVDKCPDSAIAVARSKTGRQELASPSCPANSEIGHTLAGAGVGSIQTYVGGKLYLGGPYRGDPLSVIAISPIVAGPFDIGTVVVQVALTLNPKTAEAEVDGANSDPIPHILKGIPAKIRELRVIVDRPNFTLNPTSCEESSTRAELFGSFLDVIDPSDDKPVSLSDRFQAANCAALGFKPKLALNLKGGTRRGGHPGLIANYRPRSGDANVKGLVVRLPRSAFLDQAHIRTICTRVQFAADACPPAAQYGYIKAWTPLLDEPLQGPVWLRSSNHKLPDLVFDLHGLVDIEVATRIDSAKGGIRASLENLPDAPLSKVLLRMQGGKKGLIVNSRNLCGAKSKAEVGFTGQNGKPHSSHPVMEADCGGKRRHKGQRG